MVRFCLKITSYTVIESRLVRRRIAPVETLEAMKNMFEIFMLVLVLFIWKVVDGIIAVGDGTLLLMMMMQCCYCCCEIRRSLMIRD